MSTVELPANRLLYVPDGNRHVETQVVLGDFLPQSLIYRIFEYAGLPWTEPPFLIIPTDPQRVDAKAHDWSSLMWDYSFYALAPTLPDPNRFRDITVRGDVSARHLRELAARTDVATIDLLDPHVYGYSPIHILELLDHSDARLYIFVPLYPENDQDAENQRTRRLGLLSWKSACASARPTHRYPWVFKEYASGARLYRRASQS